MPWAPKDKDVLKETFAKANLPDGNRSVQRGRAWLVPSDSQVYNEALAEKAWGRLLALYGRALA